MRNLSTKSGAAIPQVGLGTFPLQGKRLADTIVAAYEIGYRLFDTADDYRGESAIGQALSQLKGKGVQREDVFLQTKISDNHAYPDEPLMGVYFNPESPFMKRHTVTEIVREKVATSLRELKTDYLDSLLIHFPYPTYYVDIWREMIKLREEGTVRHIGVSNFSERHIDRLIRETGVCPDINELYLSPLGIKASRVAYCQEKDILVMTYSPLMDLVNKRLPAGKLAPIAEAHHKTVAQVLLRWNIERGAMPLPKSSSLERLRENLNVGDFELTADEMASIDALNVDYQYLPESMYCPGV